MWKQLVDAIKQILFLTQQTEKNREEIREVLQQLREMAFALERLAYEVHRVNEKVDYANRNEAQEREKLELRLENKLLKFERQLPSSKENEE